MSDNWKEITTDWAGESAFIGLSPSGGKVQMGSIDGQPGASPMELILFGLAGCTGVDIVSILQKKRQNLTQMRIKVRGKRRDEYPRIYTEIEVAYLLWGDKLSAAAIEQAIKLSEEKYCSVGGMLSQAAKITSTYRIMGGEDD